MAHVFIKFKLLKLGLLSAFGVEILATILAKEMCKKKKTEDLDE